jgi:hypothetical protein
MTALMLNQGLIYVTVLDVEPAISLTAMAQLMLDNIDSNH